MARKHLSRIMRRAWYLVKHLGYSMRLSMLEAWREFRERVAQARLETGKRALTVYEESPDPILWTELGAYLLTWARRIVLHQPVSVIITPNMKELIRPEKGEKMFALINA